MTKVGTEKLLHIDCFSIYNGTNNDKEPHKVDKYLQIHTHLHNTEVVIIKVLQIAKRKVN